MFNSDSLSCKFTEMSVVQSGECFECMLVAVWCFVLYLWRSSLGAFAKSRKGTINFINVRPSAWNNSAPTGRIFMKFGI